MAATQAGVTLTPPYLQVKNARGEWRTVIPQMGFPAGLPKTMTVDLTGKFLCDDSQVRIVTSRCESIGIRFWLTFRAETSRRE